MMTDSLVTLFRSQLRFGSLGSSSEESTSRSGVQKEALIVHAQAKQHGVYELSRVLTIDQVDSIRQEVDELFDGCKWTDRGASLSTRDIFVRDLRDLNRDIIFRAIDACCHTVEKIYGNLVIYNKHEVFVITYDAEPSQQAGLDKHRDGTSKAQRQTILLALDDPHIDFDGGGTRFFPEQPSSNTKRDCSTLSSFVVGGLSSSGTFSKRTASTITHTSTSLPSFVIRPDPGCGVIFPPDLMHEGVPVTRGRRHVIAVFTKDGEAHSSIDQQAFRKEQYEAARALEEIQNHQFTLIQNSSPTRHPHQRRLIPRFYPSSVQNPLEDNNETTSSAFQTSSSFSSSKCCFYTKPRSL